MHRQKTRQALKKPLHRFACTLTLVCLLPCSTAFATAYVNPPGNASAPQQLNTGDTFTNNSGVFQSTGTGVSSLGTVQVNSTSQGGNTITLNGGTVTATGTSIGGSGTIPTIPIYGGNTASNTVTLAIGSGIAKNTTRSDPNAINFVGPLLLTNSGTITGNITAGSASSITNNSLGTITGNVSLLTGSTVNLSNAITGTLTVGSGSTISLNANVASIVSGGITAPSSTLTFNSAGYSNTTLPTASGLAILNVSAGTLAPAAPSTGYAVSSQLNIASGATLTIGTGAAFSGAAATNNLGTLTINIASPAIPTGALTNSGSGEIVVGPGIEFFLPSVATNTSTATPSILLPNLGTTGLYNGGNFTTSGQIGVSSGTCIITNDGTYTFSGGTMTNIEFQNYAILNVGGVFNPTAAFNNQPGAYIYFTTGGSITPAISTGTSIFYGQNSSGTLLSGTFTVGAAISGITSQIQVASPSASGVTNSLAVSSAITFSGTSPSFTVNKNASCTITAIISGGSFAFDNEGVTTISGSGAITTTKFTNNGSFNIENTFTPSAYTAVFTNTGGLFMTSTGNISGNMTSSGFLTVGADNTGTLNAKNFSTSSTIVIPIVNVYDGSILTTTGGGTVNADVYMLGTSTLTPVSAASIFGPILTIGIDSAGNTSSTGSTSFTAPATGLSGFRSINVAAGTFSTGANTVSNVNASFTIANGAIALIPASGILMGNSTAGSNSGTLSITGTFSLNTFANSAGTTATSGVINFLSGAPTNSTIINNFSTGTVASSNIGLNIASGSTVTNTATINNYGTMTSAGTTSSTGTINNNSGGVLTFNTGASNINTLNNNSGGTLNIAGNSTFTTGIITNTGGTANGGGMNLSAMLTGPCTINNNSGGTFTFKTGAILDADAIAITNASGATLNISGNTTNNSTTTITNSGTMNVNASLSGTTVVGVTNASGGTLVFNGATNSNPITNAAGGTFNVIGTTNANTGTIMNSGGTANGGGMTLNSQLTGGGTITNLINGTLTLASSSFLVNAITNNLGGTLNVTGPVVTSANITNHGAMTIGGTISFSGAATLASTVAGSSVTVSGQQAINSVAATTYTNHVAHNTSITSPTVYDRLITNNAIDLSLSTVTITNNVNNTNGVPVSFTIIQGSALTAPMSIVPAAGSSLTSTLDRVITVATTATSIIVTINADAVTLPLNEEVAAVLNNMFSNITNSGQQSLKNAFYNVNRDLNESLQEMIPLTNSAMLDARMQTTAFGKIDTRLAGMRYGWDHSVHGGINAGDISPVSAMWMSATGSLTAQSQNGEDAGYNAKSGLFLIGRDFVSCGDILGVAGGYSQSHVKEFSNTDFISNIYRIHGLVYGSHNFKYNNYWDWLFTGSWNNNVGTRQVFIAGGDFSTHADFTALQLAAKFTRGIGFDFCDSYRLTPFTFLQYAFVHQNAYDETGSAAALSVQAINQNVLTLGLGTRFNLPLDAYRIIGMRELRAAVTYDVINSNKNTTSSFVVGSESFVVSSSPVRLALLLGAGITFEFNCHLQLELDYDFEVRSHFTDNTGLVKLKYVF